MTIDNDKLQKVYEKNLAELQGFIKQLNELDENIRSGEEQLKQMTVQRQNIFTLGMAAKKVVEELQPYFGKPEEPVVPETKEESNSSETSEIAAEDEKPRKKARVQ